MYDVFSKHLENDQYCSLKGKEVGDSMGHQGKPLTAPMGHHGMVLACLGHTDDTQARTHGFHDICGMHSVATTERSLVWPTSSPCWHKGA